MPRKLKYKNINKQYNNLRLKLKDIRDKVFKNNSNTCDKSIN